MFSKKKIELERLQRLVKKWSPLLRNLSEEEATATAFVLEAEARYVSSLSESERAERLTNQFRFVFPLLRRVVPSLLGNQVPGFIKICETLELECLNITDAVSSNGKRHYELPSWDEVRILVGSLGERIQAALIEFQEMD